MNKYLSKLILLVKLIVSSFLIYLVFSSSDNPLLPDADYKIKISSNLLILFFLTLPTLFVFWLKDKVVERYPKFAKIWKILCVIYIIILIIFSFLIINSFYRLNNYNKTQRAIIYNFGKTFNISNLFGASLNPLPTRVDKGSLTSKFTQPSLDELISPDTLPPQDSQSSEIIKINEQNSAAIGLNDKQNQIDDILEKIDILKQQIAELKENLDVNNSLDDKNNKIEQINQQNQPLYDPPKTNTLSNSGGGSNLIYPKILISEVQIAGLTGQKEEFVELYNPNTTEINLTSWYLQKKTITASSYSSFVSNTLFSGKKIGANDYFVIARENSSFASLADIITDNSLTEDNSLILKNPSGEISDKLGFGQAQEYETSLTQNPEKGQSIGRKWDTINNIEQDTNDNLADFELQNPTPKAKNITFIAPLNIPPTDTIAPEVIFSIDPIQAILNFTINFSITDPMTNVSPSVTDSYIFRWQKEGDSWQEDGSVQLGGNSAPVTLTRDFIGQDEINYYFQIKTKDIAGNESDWQPATPATTRISIFKKILINEIQIDSIIGTGGTNDDWVELYNPNSVAVSLADWSIQKHSKSDPCSTDTSFYKKNFSNNTVIPAKGFFLVVDTSASDYLQSIADMTIGWSLSEDNTIYLVRNQDKVSDGDDGDIVDKVGFGLACFSEINPALNPPEAKSIERKKPGLDTDDNSQDFRISDEPTPKENSL